MAGWHCLSGYLYWKPTGAFSRLRTKKKQWYILQENTCQLMYYRCHEDAKSNKEPLGFIDIRGAPISLNLPEENQFVIQTADGKEYVLEAENHESMMIWLLGLQAKRAGSSNSHNHCNISESDTKRSTRRRGSEPATRSYSLASRGSVQSFYSDQAVHAHPPSLSKLKSSSAYNGRFDSISMRDSSVSSEDYSIERLNSLRPNSQSLRTGNGNGGNYFPECSCSPVREEGDDAWLDISTGCLFHPSECSLREFPNSSNSCMHDHLDLAERGSEGVELRRKAPVLRSYSLRVPLSHSFTFGLKHLSDKDEEDENSQSEGDDVFNYEELAEGAVYSRQRLQPPNTLLPSCENRNTAGKDSTLITPTAERWALSKDEDEFSGNNGNSTAIKEFSHGSIEHSFDRCHMNGKSESSDSVIERECDGKIKLSALESDLLNAKKELANALNRENCLRELLEKRESTMFELDEKISRLEEVEKLLLDSQETSSNSSNSSFVSKLEAKRDKYVQEALNRTSHQMKTLQSHCRVLQNQNKFLNDEVKKLGAMKYEEQKRLKSVKHKVKELEMNIERWKRDYIFLLQSNITIPAGDVMDGFELNLYGGDRHMERLKELLEEEKQKNPGLPNFDRISQSEFHVDRYGFKHNHESEALLMHYICRQLNEHYTSQLSFYEEHQIRWEKFLEARRSECILHSKELKTLCRQGIPVQHRAAMWRAMIHARVKDIIEKHGKHYYTNLSNKLADSVIAGSHRKQISLDLLRTLPTNIHFDHNDADGIKKLQEVLQVFSIHNPDIGYCQGMNFIAGMSLLILEKEDAFWCLVAFTERYFSQHYFNSNLIGAQADQLALKDLICEKLPLIHAHLSSLDIDISTITLNWFLAVFYDAVPFETLLRIWDCFLNEGPKVLFRVALAVLKIHERVLLQQSDTISIWKHLKLAAKLTFDVEGLLKVAFEDLQPFPKRSRILQLQKSYVTQLQEKERARERKRKAFEDSESQLKKWEHQQINKPSIECVASLNNGKLWLCFGEQSSGRVAEIDCSRKVMYEVDFEIDSRILCICVLNSDVVLIGSLSMNLYAFHTHLRCKLWQLQMHDSVMDLCITFSDDQKQNRLFAALADGTVAVLENVSHCEPSSAILYVRVDISPVTSLLLVNQHLWCACGNVILILNAHTLDQKDRLKVSCNPLDHILCMRLGQHGVWVSVKGSSIIELWDENKYKCKLLFDVRENKYSTSKKEEETHFNPQRITSLLPLRNTIWVGSGDGDLIVYEVSEKDSPILGGFHFTGSSTNINIIHPFTTSTTRSEDLERSVSLTVPVLTENNSNETKCIEPRVGDVNPEPQQHATHASPVCQHENEQSEHTMTSTSTDIQTSSSSIQRPQYVPLDIPTGGEKDGPSTYESDSSNLRTCCNRSQSATDQVQMSDQGIVTRSPCDVQLTHCSVELTLLVKNKIAESPIRCMKDISFPDSTIIISCSSSFEEDECVLKWTRENNENKIWTNEPIFRICQHTQTVQLPAYMKHRLSHEAYTE